MQCWTNQPLNEVEVVVVVAVDDFVPAHPSASVLSETRRNRCTHPNQSHPHAESNRSSALVRLHSATAVACYFLGELDPDSLETHRGWSSSPFPIHSNRKKLATYSRLCNYQYRTANTFRSIQCGEMQNFLSDNIGFLVLCSSTTTTFYWSLYYIIYWISLNALLTLS